VRLSLRPWPLRCHTRGDAGGRRIPGRQGAGGREVRLAAGRSHQHHGTRKAQCPARQHRRHPGGRACRSDQPRAAVEQWQTEISERQRLAAVGTLRAQAATDDASADYLRKAGSYAQRQAYLNAGIDDLGAASNGAVLAGAEVSAPVGLPAGAATWRAVLRARAIDFSPAAQNPSLVSLVRVVRQK
jgi:hypothetical protein